MSTSDNEPDVVEIFGGCPRRFGAAPTFGGRPRVGEAQAERGQRADR